MIALRLLDGCGKTHAQTSTFVPKEGKANVSAWVSHFGGQAFG